MKMRRGKTAITDDNSKWGHTCKCRDAEIDKQLIFWGNMNSPQGVPNF